MIELLLPLAAVAFQGGPPDTVDEILERHVAARGGYAAIKAIQTLVYSDGTYREGDFVSPGGAFMAYKRPFFRLVGNPERPGGFMEGYDGSTWEWYADPGVVLRTVGAASEAIRHGAIFDAPLIDYRKRGTKIRLGEPREVDGRPVLTLEVTLRDGFSFQSFLDQETYLVVGSRHSAPIHAFGEEVLSESRFSDYRPVAGVLFPHRDVSVDVATGEPLSEMQWGRIEANRELPDAWFSPPVFERSRLQTLVEQLYYQRADAKAILWTYHDYRALFPELDTRTGVEFIGYHMLKMGSLEQAITLLKANLADHPDSSSAAYELGRAHQTAGDLESACWQYEQALVLDANNERAAEALEALE